MEQGQGMDQISNSEDSKKPDRLKKQPAGTVAIFANKAY